MFSKHVKQFLKETFLECNVNNQIKIYLTISLILLIMRQLDYTYFVRSHKYLRSMFVLITSFCGIKILYDKKYYKTAYFGMVWVVLYVCLATTLLYKRLFEGKYYGNYIDSNDVNENIYEFYGGLDNCQ